MYSFSEYKPCPEGHFRCSNASECLDIRKRCDGHIDCFFNDGKDDEGCEPPTHSPVCGKNQYECKNGICIPEPQTCDGIDQCGDATDELLCGECLLSSHAVLSSPSNCLFTSGDHERESKIAYRWVLLISMEPLK